MLLLPGAPAMLATMAVAKRALRAFRDAWSQVYRLPDGYMATQNASSALVRTNPLVHPRGQPGMMPHAMHLHTSPSPPLLLLDMHAVV